MTETTSTQPTAQPKPAPAPRKRPSRAAGAAAKNAAAKPATARKPAAAKPAPKPELGPNEQKAIVAEALIRAAGELARNWSDKRVDRKLAAELLGTFVSYTPGSFWVRELPEPQTGRGQRHRLAK